MVEGVARRGIGGASGTYNVRASELARHKVLRTIRVQITFLDQTTQVFEIQKRGRGQALLDLVFTHLELVERDYFGLQYIDPILTAAEGTRRWLDPLKSVKKQLRLCTKALGNCPLPNLFFRVKFWVSDPGKLAEEYTRYHVVLQLRHDVFTGALHAPPSTAVLLASYALQSDLGDYSPDYHDHSYLSELQCLSAYNQEITNQIIELHKIHRGQSPADAEYNFLDHAKRLDLYGVDLHPARDSTNREIQLGVSSTGLVVFLNEIRMNTFSWAKIIKISFKRKQFFIQLRREVVDEQPKSGRNAGILRKMKVKLLRQSESFDSVLGFNLGSYRACKCLWKSCVEHHTFFRLHSPRPANKRNLLSLGSKFRYSGRTEFQTVEEWKKRPPVERSFVRSPSKQLVRQAPLPRVDNGTHSKSRSSSGSSLRTRSDSSAYKVTSLPETKTPKMAWGEETEGTDEQLYQSSNITEDTPPTSGVINGSPPIITTTHCKPTISSPSSSSATSTDQGASSDQPGGGDENAHGLVTIKMKPDDQGKFGFNVKGGVDKDSAVLVARVAPGTPADRCYPRLNEGDQVLLINGRDVSSLTHEQVVNFIRASRECHSGELVLTVKQNVYLGDEPDVEPEFQYVPEALADNVPSGGGEQGALQESMLLLEEGLDAGSLVAQFEQLYRRKPGLTVIAARKPENEKKNRYRDISPYDTTRVMLATAASGDYINGSYVNMEVQGSGIINRYIACQGPLAATCVDFWQMIWEQQSTLVVMLTTVIEQGRIKCHRYWPRLSETVEFGCLKVTCLKEEETDGFAFREFKLINTQEEDVDQRHITHMQYLAWPDHGVPDDSADFLNFIGRVREARSGMVEPTVVHCSAGIGRTGVLILMETAQCLIEANEPVYPYDIVKSMRDQRAMMIQTASQYRFVCEAIQRVYAQGMVKPLPEYQQR